MNDNMVTPNIPLALQTFTRGNSLKIVNRRLDVVIMIEENFLFIIESPRNSLPEDIVTAQLLNSFLNKLDKHCHFHERRFNRQAEITGTGSRSKVKEFCLCFF